MYDITVILAIYNMQNYIRGCLESVISQTNLDRVRLRVLCINDGSTDGTAEILAEYANKYSWIEVHHKENGGVSSARNLGLDLVENSSYITFLDPDDSWEPNYLEAVERGIKTGSDTIFFNINLVNRSGSLLKKLEVCPEFNMLSQDQARRRMILAKPASWTRIHRAELYEGNRFPLGRIYEDLALMPYITAQSKSIYYAPEYIYNYVVDVNNSIMNSSYSAIFDIYPAFDYLFSKFGDSFSEYSEEIHYLMLEHLGIGQSYRLLGFPQANADDYKRIADTLEENFGKDWRENLYVRQGVQRVNINSKLSLIVPQVLFFLSGGFLCIVPLLNNFYRRMQKFARRVFSRRFV